jgi:hypothetical protein
VLDAMKERGEIRDWVYEEDEFFFEKIRRGVRFYKPDFRLDYFGGEPSVYFEVKGFMDKKSATALDRMRRYYPETTVLVVGKEQYMKYKAEFGDHPDWED